MVKIVPYLMLSDGKAAIKYYKELFGAKLISHQPFNEEVGKQFGFTDDYNYENSTMHAELDVFGSTIYLSDNSDADNAKNIVEIALDFATDNCSDDKSMPVTFIPLLARFMA